jgi:hypothetical protein
MLPAAWPRARDRHVVLWISLTQHRACAACRCAGVLPHRCVAIRLGTGAVLKSAYALAGSVASSAFCWAAHWAAALPTGIVGFTSHAASMP